MCCSSQKKVETAKPAAAPAAVAAPPKAKAPSTLAKTSTKVTKKKNTTATPSKGAKSAGKKKAKAIKYFIDCTHPVEDGIFDIAAFVRQHHEEHSHAMFIRRNDSCTRK
jgi:hypothetical protein